MQRKITTAALAGAMLAGITGTATAQDSTELTELRARVAQLETQSQGDWLTDARAEEVRGLVQEVLADADTRASLLQEGALAGINEDGKVFLQSADGQFSMNIAGQIQFRYYLNSEDNRSTSGISDETASGFELRRAKVKFSGTVADGWDYLVVLASSRTDGNTVAEDVVIGRDLGDGLSVKVGLFKLPFARQELISSTRQVAVDRGLTTEFFTLSRAEQIQLTYAADQYRVAVSISDGANSGNSVIPNGAATPTTTGSNDFAVTARGDYLISGEWNDGADEFAGGDGVLLVGGAVHYETYDGGGTADSNVAWTVDGIWKQDQYAISAAIFGSHVKNDVGGVDTDQYGYQVQGNVKIDDKWNVFARWEMIDDDNFSGAADSDDFQAVTVGVNHHFNDNVKFTADVVWVYSGDDPTSNGGILGGESSSGLGMQSGVTDDEDQIAFRAQLQLLF